MLIKNPFSSPKKTLVIFAIFLLIASLGITTLLLLKKNREKNNIDKVVSSELNVNNDFYQGNPISTFESSPRYRLNCQIFYDEVDYKKTNIGDYTIHASAPCYYKLADDSVRSVEIPLLITNQTAERFLSLGAANMGPLRSNLNENEILKKAMINRIFDFNQTLHPSLLVKLFFHDKEYGKSNDLGDFISPATFIGPLLDIVQQDSKQESFAKTGIFKDSEYQYLFYVYSEVKGLE